MKTQLWKCECGWIGSIDEMKNAQSGHKHCPKCGKSGTFSLDKKIGRRKDGPQ
jgi:hypothetical protein